MAKKKKKSNNKKKTNKNRAGVIIPVMILLLLALVFGGTLISRRQSTLSSDFTPIFCNQYEFTCCVEKEKPYYNINLGWKNTQNVQALWTCPNSATRCEIQYTTSGFSQPTRLELRKTSSLSSCKYDDTFELFGTGGYDCSSYETISIGESLSKATLSSGESIFWKPTNLKDYYVTITVREFYNQLLYTGRAGGTVGVPVLGADQCTFVTNEDIYDDNGNLKRSARNSEISYTVDTDTCVLSYQQGDRTICGYVEEQCQQDSECGGHTYGNFECKARRLERYGCRQLRDVPSELEETDEGYKPPIDSENQKNYGTITTKRCEVLETTTVQCCGDTDCGSNAVCDTNPNSDTAFTCQTPEDVECNQDADCGVSVQCDPNALQYVKPTCVNNKCQLKKVESVDCCTDAQCSDGYYCSRENTCKESTTPKTTCPYSCCEGETRYFEKACPDSQQCCPTSSGRECKATCEVLPPKVCKPLIDIKNPVNENKSWIRIDNPFCGLKEKLQLISLISGGIFGLATFFLLKKRYYDDVPKKKKDSFNLIIFLIASVLVGGIVYIAVKSFFDFLFSFWGIVTLIFSIIVFAYFNKIKTFLRL